MKPLFCLVAIWPAMFVQAQHCRIAGQVFFADVFNHRITVKTDSGDLVNFDYDATTNFLRARSASQQEEGADRVQPEQLNNGDRLCVETSKPLVVMAIPRAEIEVEQKEELAAWQAHSLYGLVSEVDRKSRRITLDVSSGDKTTRHSVDLSPNAVYWFVPGDFTCLSDAVTGSLDRVATGDKIYVRGSTDQASQTFVARLVVAGGFRSFAGTIETMDILNDLVRVHLALSGNPRTVHIRLGDLYTTISVRGVAPKETRRLYPIEAADLAPGDTALILGVDDARDSVRACALIIGFSPARMLPADPTQQMRWIFDNVFLGDPDLTPLTGKP